MAQRTYQWLQGSVKKKKQHVEKKHMKETLKLLVCCICAGICFCTSRKMPRALVPAMHPQHSALQHCSTQHCSTRSLKGPAKILRTGTFLHTSSRSCLGIPLSAAHPARWALEVTPKFSTKAAAALSLSAPQSPGTFCNSPGLDSASREIQWGTSQSRVKQPKHRV